MVRGRLRERACRTEVAAAPLSLVVKPAGVVHADDFGPEPIVTCQIRLDAAIHDAREWRAPLARWRWIVGGAAVRAALRLARVLRTRPRESDDVAESVIGVLASLEPPPETGSPPAWLARATAFLEDEVASGAACVRVAAAAAAVGVHPVHLTRVFRQHHGCTVSAFVSRRRAQRVALAGMSARGYSVIAHAAGFADHSHMNRAFRRETGLLPRDLGALGEDA